MDVAVLLHLGILDQCFSSVRLAVCQVSVERPSTRIVKQLAISVRSVFLKDERVVFQKESSFRRESRLEARESSERRRLSRSSRHNAGIVSTACCVYLQARKHSLCFRPWAGSKPPERDFHWLSISLFTLFPCAATCSGAHSRAPGFAASFHSSQRAVRSQRSRTISASSTRGRASSRAGNANTSRSGNGLPWHDDSSGDGARDRDLWFVLEIASDQELQELADILYGRRQGHHGHHSFQGHDFRFKHMHSY